VNYKTRATAEYKVAMVSIIMSEQTSFVGDRVMC